MAYNQDKEITLALRQLEDLILGDLPGEGQVFSDFVPPGAVQGLEKYLGEGKGRRVVFHRPNLYSEYGILGVFKAGREPSPEAWPLKVMCVSGIDESVSHRDILGSLMSLGVARKKIGDIFCDGDRAYVVVTASLYPYFKDQLRQIRHQAVTVEAVALKVIEDFRPRFEEEVVLLSSLRIDLVLSKVFKTSREEGKTFFQEGRVKLNHLPVDNPHKILSEGDLVSLRGHGRVRIDEIQGTTKKGNLKVAVQLMK